MSASLTNVPRHPSLADRLALDAQDADAFVSASPTESPHVFGGLLIGQALRAAQSTVARSRSARSVHATFLAAGTGGQAVRYQVERTRDGGSFSTRRIVARQDKGPVLVMTADFHDDEPGLEYQVPATPDVPMPDDLPAGRYGSDWFESRDAPVGAVTGGPTHARHSWFRPTAPVPDDALLHQQVLAYLSDHGPTRAARQPHHTLDDDTNRMSVSLDHSVWFHRPVDVNQWLLSELMPMSTGRGRGLSLGTIRTSDGSLIATVAQEVLLRSR